MLPVYLSPFAHNFVALQFDLTSPYSAALDQISLGSGAEGFEIHAKKISDYTIRFIIFNMDNFPFSSIELPVLNIELDDVDELMKYIGLSNILISDYDGKLYSLNLKFDQTTGVVDLYVENKNYNVFNSQGMRVLTTSKKEDLSKLIPGIYIINGKKVMIGE